MALQPAGAAPIQPVPTLTVQTFLYPDKTIKPDRMKRSLGNSLQREQDGRCQKTQKAGGGGAPRPLGARPDPDSARPRFHQSVALRPQRLPLSADPCVPTAAFALSPRTLVHARSPPCPPPALWLGRGNRST